MQARRLSPLSLSHLIVDMEKFSLVREGESKLPPGFRFQPTDEEIVFQYLSRKTFNHPMPALVIPELDVFTYDPWELPGNYTSHFHTFFILNICKFETININL